MELDDSEQEDAADRRLLPKLENVALDGYELDIAYFLGKEYADVGEAATELPVVLEWINAKLQAVIQDRALTEDEVKENEAKAWQALRSGKWTDLGYVGSITAHSMTMAIRLDGPVADAKKRLAVLMAWESRLINLMYAVRSKLDLVRTAEATNRIVFRDSTT